MIETDYKVDVDEEEDVDEVEGGGEGRRQNARLAFVCARARVTATCSDQRAGRVPLYTSSFAHHRSSSILGALRPRARASEGSICTLRTVGEPVS